MAMTELLGSSLATALSTGAAVYAIMYKLLVKPLKDEHDIFKLAVEKDVASIKKELKVNSVADQELRERHIRLEAKHSAITDTMNAMDKKLDKIFELLEKRAETESAINTRLTKLEANLT